MLLSSQGVFLQSFILEQQTTENWNVNEMNSYLHQHIIGLRLLDSEIYKNKWDLMVYKQKYLLRVM